MLPSLPYWFDALFFIVLVTTPIIVVLNGDRIADWFKDLSNVPVARSGSVVPRPRRPPE